VRSPGSPPAVVPADTKNWTWVLDRGCPECGLDTRTVPRAAIAGAVLASAEQWPTVLAGVDAAVRPEPTTWSALEYACHVRDVFRVFDYRLALMLGEHDPLFPNWDQDATAVAEQYWASDPGTVSSELLGAGRQLAGALAVLEETQWARPGRRSDGARFTVETFARYLLHDPVHHLWDVRRARR
jgi:hypothetical protein